MADVDYADALALLSNTPAQIESLLHCQEQAAKGTSLYVNSNKLCLCVLNMVSLIK